MNPESPAYGEASAIPAPLPLQPPTPLGAPPPQPAPSPEIPAPTQADLAPEPAPYLAPEEYPQFLTPEQLAALEAEEERLAQKIAFRSKLSAILISVGIHLALGLSFSLIIMSMPREKAPQIVATTAPFSNPEETIQQQEIVRPNPKQVEPSARIVPVITAINASAVAMPSLDEPPPDLLMTGLGTQDGFGMSVSFEDSDSMSNLPVIFSSRCSEAERLSRLKVGGGSKRCEDAVQRALVWLASQQKEDGSLGRSFPVAMTGLTLLAFLGRCETPDSPQFSDAVVNASLYLLNVASQAEGKLMSPGGSYAYEHGIATYALCELFTLSRRGSRRIPGLAEMLRKSVDIIIKGQNPDGSWLYQYRPGRPDTSVAGWQMQALHAAKHTGIDFPGLEQAFAKGVTYIKSVQGPKGGFGYERAEDRISLTGIGILALQFDGQGPGSEVQKGLQFILSTRKTLSYEGINFYEWYYSTQACFQAEGKTWKQWNDMFLDPLLGAQDKRGFWPRERSNTTDNQSKGDGDIYRTCLATLMLEVYYRYLPTGEKIKAR